jgi:signal transduction histidine kinase
MILGAALASILGLVIFLIAELDNPFRGSVSIGPDTIAHVYEDIMKPRQTATPEQAMAMLARAVAAVQADKTKALAMFNTGEGGFLDEDLYPYCFNVGDGRIVADVNQPKLVGQKAMDLKDATGKPFGLELYKAAQKSEGEITDVSYMFPKPGSEQQLAPKVAFETRVGDLACAVGYYQ